MRVLGLSAFYHDSAAALIEDGRLVAAAQEERFTRIKHDARFPLEAIRYCLAEGNVQLSDVDCVAFYDKPFLKLERLLETYLGFAPRGFRSFATAMPTWIKGKLFQKVILERELRELWPDFDSECLLFGEHHFSHAASAYFASPFDEAVVLTMDGVGEWTTTSVSHGRGNALRILRELHFPHSLGMLYSAFTTYAGFKVNSGEYKLMGLAPYGQQTYRQRILDHLIDVKADGSFRLDMRYFDYCTGLRMTNARFHALFGGPPRLAEEPLTQRHMDLAASVQAVVEDVILKLTAALHRETQIDNLCLAGGVALNCVANGKIRRQGSFKRLWVQPAAGDAGGALGAALAAYHVWAGKGRISTANGAADAMHGCLVGPSYSDAAIEQALTTAGARFRSMPDEDGLLDEVAGDLEAGRAVGWFQGRMEFGPRALGARSILADPRSAEMQRTLNLKVKFRESFRPFAPAVLEEHASEWFDLDDSSPYMALVASVAENKKVHGPDSALVGLARLNEARSVIPAVTHVDGSARIQTVSAATNRLFHALLTRFQRRTGCPVLVNTSFNVRGEPIVCTPADAFRCFMGTDIETLAIGSFLLRKEEQTARSSQEYRFAFAPD